MMSSGYLTVAEGSWGSSRLPRKLLMSVMLMIVMMYSYTSAYVEIISYSPADGFTVGREDTLDISCLYKTNNPDWFKLKRNYTIIAEIENNEIKMHDNDFSCTLNQLISDFGVVNCRKKNLNCQDVGLYSCWLKDGDHSSMRFLRVKPSIKSFVLAENDFQMSRMATFKCTANVPWPNPWEEVVFRWTLIRNGRNVVTEDRARVWGSDKCYTEVTSSYKHVVHFDSFSSHSIISCTVFNQTRTRNIDPPMPRDLLMPHLVYSTINGFWSLISFLYFWWLQFPTSINPFGKKLIMKIPLDVN
ncbi:uncharacterized protein LOC115229977 isoform X2 [Octopus sinensis]|uniref:Uncharacterized protein LOC115229977 isoform X2 n=1 Tax=Octopus sinensis TaxID=2607531 RepID=A0A7E6EJA0_9MOLL|nr:uncharacterized protein LOC115229977 isoform X2 [Octopus sinensis]